jgi:hypothetical protein
MRCMSKAADVGGGDLSSAQRKTDTEQQAEPPCGAEMSATQACVSQHPSPAPESRRHPAQRPARALPTGEETFDWTPVFHPTAAAPEPAFQLDQRVTG